ncbi:hypothetical protein BDN72DRAFT_819995 [Pluteus cervinus]|uniref:Uncharacterized protein n=1 Tax=Pluteus cervinus TaxID=181527 RepID=A0ACD3AUP7_9AGAR|nr:hypothetical protein BDN72DRAFT_819995 [Pluteus cervinus]
MTSSRAIEENIRDAYLQSHSLGDVSKVEHAYDRTIELGTGLPDNGPLGFVRNFFAENQATIESTATGLLSLTSEGKSIETAVNNFAETAKVMIKGLDALAQVHPAIGVAVLAFKLVVTFDMTRRENNKKVLALKIEMQDMMAVLFELRHIADPMEEGPDGSPLGARIQTLMDRIANDIKDAGSACDAYLKKSFLARTLKSKIYETRLAEYGAMFETNKADIQQSLTMHTARGVDAANEKLVAQGLTLNKMSRKFDRILQIFGQLNSPQEMEVQRFLEENGGAQTCIEDDELLEQLVSKSGQLLSDASGSMARGHDLWDARKLLLKEFHEDVDKMFDNHVAVFHGKLDIQSTQLEAIQTILTSGSHERIVDPDLKTIWKEMGWKGSVKARHFVLALHDYFSDGSLIPSKESNTSPRTPNALSPPIDLGPTADITSTKPGSNDEWTLAYVNVAHVQPILEAIDDDGTGLISIKKVNVFVTSRPPDWTLLQRLAYWAAGWHRSISSYRTKIYLQVQKMFKLLVHLMPSNRSLVEEYLKSLPLVRLEHILRSTKSAEGTKHDPELSNLINYFDAMEEERLTKNLVSVAYELDSAETVSLVTGPGRIERYLFPLVYVMLKRDLRLIMLACRFRIREEELWVAAQSLHAVFKIVNERIGMVTGIFKQIHADVNARLEVFAFGMFQTYYDRLYNRERSYLVDLHNSYLKWQSDTGQTNQKEKLQDEIDSIPLTELKLGPDDSIDLGESIQNSIVNDVPNELTPRGHWSGHVWLPMPDGDARSFLGLLELRIDLSGREIVGSGQTFGGALSVSGTLDEGNDIRFSMKFKHGITLMCHGKFYPDYQSIRASWVDGYFQAANESRFIRLWRTPTHLNRFRSELLDEQTSLARARWAFVRKAILYEVRRKSWSWAYLQPCIKETKRIFALSVRHRINSWNITPNDRLNPEETNELYLLQTCVDVRISRICTLLAEFHINRLMVRHHASCDSCQRAIYETRIICLVCIEKDFSNSFDVCRPPCLTASASRKKLNHSPSHSMIKYEYVVHDYNEVWASRTIATHAKEVLNAARVVKKEEERSIIVPYDASGTPKPTTLILCICCSKGVTVPCWVCQVCARGTFICSDCEGRRVAPPEKHTHKLNHPQIRIGTVEPDPRTAADEIDIEERLVVFDEKVDTRVARLETMVQDVQERTRRLETRVEEQFTRVQERLTQLEANIEDRFSVLESLLRQIMTQGEGSRITQS